MHFQIILENALSSVTYCQDNNSGVTERISVTHPCVRHTFSRPGSAPVALFIHRKYDWLLKMEQKRGAEKERLKLSSTDNTSGTYTRELCIFPSDSLL